jgi:lysyl endopeptidase
MKTIALRLKVFILYILLLTLSRTIHGQITTRSISAKESPQYSIHKPTNSSISHKVLPPFDLNAVLKEDSLEMNSRLPFRFGKAMDVDIDIFDLGTRVNRSDTTLIYYQISSEGAFSINLIFDKFFLNSNTSLKIYNVEQSILYGPITEKENPTNGIFWTDLIKGDNIIIEVSILGKTTKGNELHISKVIHAYKNVFTAGYGQSAWCNRDIACPEGNNWHTEADAVAMLLLFDGSRFCTGSLLNNTTLNFTPYFLTAFHCVDVNGDGVLSTSEKNAVNNWVFRFKYESPFCGGGDGNTYMSFNGSSFRAAYQPSDFSLLELYSHPSAGQGISFAGWSRSNNAATSAAGIHHPAGDVKKISIENNTLTNVDVTTTWSTNPTTITCPPNTHWAAIFESGTVQPGSSGSPIFDQNHRIVGQLHGDYLNTDDNYCVNLRGQYGRFDVSWTGGGTDETRLSNWLDPCNSGAITTNTLRSLYISGPTLVCSSGATFTVNNVPAGSTITWSSSSNVTLPTNRNSNPIVATANGSGSGWVQATINSSTCGSVTLPQYPVWVGTPGTSNIQGPSQLPVGCIVSYSVSAQGNPTSYQWSMAGRILCPPNQQWYYLYGDHTSTATLFAGCQSRYIGVTVGNQCGTAYVGKYVEIGNYNCNGGMKMSTDTTFKETDTGIKTYLVIYPNPASDNVQVNLVQSTDQNSVLSDASSDQNGSAVYLVRVFNIYGTMVYTLNNTSCPFTIPLSGFKDGTYIINVSDKYNTYQKQLIVKH